MRYRKTFAEAVKEVWAKAAKKKEDEKKDCTYCNKYEKLSDWPENERPIAFIYEKVDKSMETFELIPISQMYFRHEGEQERKLLDSINTLKNHSSTIKNICKI